ncbi:MAG: bifunctional [glutamine synthetase] adenylyltransferase/[glutamine synthetase]-adenylyl-L-tyrosine phosphorylase [Alphaproteobacteria bacterium]
MAQRLITAREAWPKPASAELAARGVASWLDAAESCDRPVRRFAREMAGDSDGRSVLEAVFGNSPFLGRLMLLETPFVRTLAEGGFEDAFAGLIERIRDGAPTPEGDDGVMRLLRRSKRRVSLLVALADIGGAWPLERVTGALSEFADAALELATRHALARAADGSGLIVLGMGKLGAHELNYSSDVDLVVLYDPERIETSDRDGLQQRFVRLARALVRLMSERTTEGYVFRTDLRLRPDPGATPPALSTIAAETYYESMGQNWERAALIKARPVAGDLEAGRSFVRQLRPFIWRKHLDFAAIQDIHSIKRQINAHRGGRDVAVAGHNVKLGRGGIREVELFCQTQQLIWGGREPALRVPGTVEALRALVSTGRLAADAADRLIAAYRFLRRVEHRLQMVADEQTHTLPEDPAGLEAFARFLGFEGRAAFEREFVEHLRAVESQYAQLFEAAPELGGPGNLVFTGTDHDPETLETLRRLGFVDPAQVSALVRGWHHGRFRAMRSTRARELLTEITPALLAALGRTANPNAAFARFDAFLRALPAGVPLFSLFYANPGLLDLVAEIMGYAPRLAEHLARKPAALEAMLATDSGAVLPARGALEAELERALDSAGDFQDVLDGARRWSNDHKFRVGIRALRGALDAEEASLALTWVAEVAIASVHRRVEAAFALQHGRVPDSGMVVVALGKLGGREMTITSDLDLLFVYDCPADTAASDGPRPLAPSQYFQRLAQRLLNALAAPTGEGRLYEVDMRLRPSGNKGPIATNLEAFVRYQREGAWVWEHMALLRARVISGPEELKARVERAIRDAVTTPREPAALARDVLDMRRRIEREHRARSRWDLKHVRGGLLDVEFIAQYLQLTHAGRHPEVLTTNTVEALERLAEAGLIDSTAAAELAAAARLWHTVQGILRLTVEGPFEEEGAPEGLRALLAKATGASDFQALKSRMRAAARLARAQFKLLLERTSATAGPGQV